MTGILDRFFFFSVRYNFEMSCIWIVSSIFIGDANQKCYSNHVRNIDNERPTTITSLTECTTKSQTREKNKICPRNVCHAFHAIRIQNPIKDIEQKSKLIRTFVDPINIQLGLVRE